MPRKKTKPILSKKPVKRRREKIQRPRGMKDLLPADFVYVDFIKSIADSTLRTYSFRRMDTPIAESVDLFVRAIGEDTDIVEKEMFVLKGRSREEKLALRPEFTAGVCRAYIENGMASMPQPLKLFSWGPIFRGERPQSGRYRQFNQINFEIIGGSKPALDAQTIQIAWRILERLGLKNLVVQINSIGCEECRPVYRQMLIDYYKPNVNKLCADCKRRIKKNPLRLLDCKEEKCQRVASNAPQMFDNLCEDCHDHFKLVLELLDELDIPYMLNSSLVRGLDYYTKTVFEIRREEDINHSGSQLSLCGGGRYDGLIELLGGSPTPAVGVAIGVERIILEMKEKKIVPPEFPKPRVFLAQLGELAKREGFKIFERLYLADIDVVESFGRDSLKSQLKQAEKQKVQLTLILGQKEAVDGNILIRDMGTGIQEVTSQEKMIGDIKERLKAKEDERNDKIKMAKKKTK
ncbi:MAG: hypothetical protein ACD_63C00211G0002 [uncultured bacterium]|nr:MAG: hypothetical protein ACD_63C00211G0002 [uncultured bacterium]